MQLFAVVFQVLPAVWHPMYYETEGGLLYLFVYAKESSEAERRARVILEELPYEQKDGEVLTMPAESLPKSIFDKISGQIAQAKFLGFSLALGAIKTGDDWG